MTITVELPDDIMTHADPGREALEAFAISAFRSGKLNRREMRLLLGFETRWELDGFLKSHEVFDGAYDVADFESDLAALERVKLDRKIA